MKIHRLVMHQEFNAPVEKVWEAFNDHENFGKMMGQRMTRVIDSPDPANINGINSVRKIHVPLIAFEETIRKSEKPRCIEYQISKASPLAHHYGTLLFTSLPNGKSALDYTIELGSNAPLWAPFVKTLLNIAIRESIKKYARTLEA